MKMPNLSSPCSPRSFFIFIFCFLVLPLLLLLLLLATPSSSSWSSSSSSHGGDHHEAEKVTMSIYYETLCPYCAEFIVNHVVSIFQTGLISIVNLRMIPWGNAFLKPDGSFVCQIEQIYANQTGQLDPPIRFVPWVVVDNHSLQEDYPNFVNYICAAFKGYTNSFLPIGPDECKLNSLESCVLNLWDDVSKNYALIYSFEFLVIEGRLEKWKNCFSELGLPQKPVLECYNQGNGTQLGRKYVNETANLKPPHKFLPWVVVNNQPIGRDYANFTTYVCKAYDGSTLPAACNKLESS